MKPIKTLGIITGLVAFVLLVSCLFTVTQGEHGLLLRLGRLVQDANTGKPKIYAPGLHIKYPFIEQARIFDTRIQTIDIQSSRIVTKERKDVMVDYYVKWRINDLGQYFRATSGDKLKAETLLEQQLNTSLRAQFGKRTIADVVSSVRDDIMDVLRVQAERQASQLGMSVVDVRIKGIELPANTSNAIYQRMRADMFKIASRHRADGQAQAEAIQAGADAKVTVLLATAQADAQAQKAKGQATAANIYVQSYGQDKSFFSFYKSLKAYVASFKDKQDILVLEPSGTFFEFFKQDKLGSVSKEPQ